MAELLVKKKSVIHGFGIFVNRDIEKDNIFYTVPLKSIFDESKPGCAFIGKNRWVCDKEVLNFVNHSCDPNSVLDISDKPVLMAERNIKANEEITVDYDETEIKGKKVKCDCKNEKCKKYFLRIE